MFPTKSPSGVESNPSPEGSRVSSTKPERPKRHFVAEADRRRASRACDGCRRTKEKCEGGVPCNRCVRTRRSCHFSPISVLDGPRAAKGSNANGQAGQTERVKLLEQISLHFLGQVSLDLPSLREISESLNIERPKTAEGISHDDDELDDLDLEEDTYTVKTLSKNVAHYSGELSHWNFSERILKRVDESLGTDDVEVRAPIVEYYRPSHLQSPSSTIISIAESLPPREVAEFLLQMFFRFADPTYFYIEESWVRHHLSILQEPSATITSNDSAWICAVLMVLAIGTQYAHLAGGPSQDDEMLSEAPEAEAPQPELGIGVGFYHIASKLLPDVIAIASLESVQACLLLGAYTLTVDTQGIAYTYVGLAVKIAIQNGLHRRYSGRELDSHVIELRNRLWWTAYSLEKRICILHGRPGTVAITDIDAELPVENEDFDGMEHSRFPNISSLIYLTIRLGDISHAITLLRRCPKRLQPNYFDRLMEIRNQLQKWWQALGTPVPGADLSPQDPLFRSHIHLKLCYHLNQIFMGRPFIFTPSGKSPSRSESAAGNTPASPPLSGAGGAGGATSPPEFLHRSSKVAALIPDAVAAALTIVDLCALLDKHEGLARASYIEFSSCRAALLLLLAQSLNERTPQLRTAVETGIRMLRRCTAGGNVSHKSDVSIIEALDAGVRMLHAEQEAAAAAGAAGRQKESGYERFRSWANLWRSPSLGDAFGTPPGLVDGAGGVGTGGGGGGGPDSGVTTASAAGAAAHLTGLDFSDFTLNPGFDFSAPVEGSAPVTGMASVGTSAGTVGGLMPPALMQPDLALSGMFSPMQYINGAEFLDDEWQWNPAGLDSLDAAFYQPAPPHGPPT